MTRRSWLRPLVPVYEAVIAAKQELLQRGWLRPKRLRHPVISVGSLSAGGAGKTPVVLMLAELLGRRGFEVRILTRGYGRRSRIIQRVDPNRSDDGAAGRFGDEPLMMARRLAAIVPQASVWVGADRHRAGSLAEKNNGAPGGKVVYLLDDGFQHRRLARDIDLVLITRQDFADGLLPAGNLREPLKAAGRADVIAVREDEEFAGRFSGKAKTWTVRRQLRFTEELSEEVTEEAGRPWLFCGLARPESFQNMLAATGTRVAGSTLFRDHHAYSAADVERLVTAAVAAGADGFVTTQKDAVKLSAAMLKRLRTVGPVAAPELQVTLLNESACMDELLEILWARFASIK